MILVNQWVDEFHLKKDINHMNYLIRKVAVLGSGVMGTGIAAHLSNCGFDVLLLDIPSKENTNKNI